MQCRTVCISFSDGAGGQEIARIVAGELGFRLLDEAIVLRAAEEAGVEPDLVADVERRQSWLRRVLTDLGSGDFATMPAGEFGPASLHMTAAGDLLRSSDLRDLIRAAIEETAAQGDTIIVAHAASQALAERSDVLRVLVTASPEKRAKRLAETEKVDEREAARLLERGDTARRDYLRRFYGQRAELPTSYDIVLNTDRLSEREAARLITEAARAESSS
jgi:hypothetical protein